MGHPTQPAAPRVRRDSPLMYVGILLMFAPLGVLQVMVQDPPRGWITAFATAAFTGAVSTGWAYTFIRGRWWLLFLLIPAPLFVPPLFFWTLTVINLHDFGMDFSPRVRLIVMAIMCVVFTSVGFILAVVHQRRTERRTARALAELDLAAQMHRALVPPITVDTPIAEVYGRSNTSSTMGGDLIDAVQGDSRIDVLVGDVSGHGVSAGVVMAMLKSCIRMRLLQAASLRDIVSDTNKVLTSLTAPSMFATFAAVRLRPDHTMEFALAGHLPIFHYRAAQQRWEQHPNQNLPLGIDEEEDFLSGSTTVARGDILVLLTDGLMEVQNKSGKELGLTGVAGILASSMSSSLSQMHDKVMTSISSYGPQLDDQSLVLIKLV
jgi:hypothetical protein